MTQSITKEQADKAYRDGSPLMTDAEYDKKFGLNASDVDTEFENSIWPKEKLSIPMGSLLKENAVEDLVTWMDKYSSNVTIWSDKLDGSSGQLTYEDGKLVKGVTRGDGTTGDDVTPNVLKMKVPQTIDLKGTTHIRVEFILFIEDREKHFSEKKNPRNAAAGAIRRLDGVGCEHIRCLAFDIHNDSLNIERKIEKFQLLEKLGFEMPNFGITTTAQQIAELIDEVENKTRAKLPYEIDGLVFEADDINHYLSQGERSGRPKAARAFKFTAESATTTIKSITWQIGKTGFVTPVGELEPTNIQGITISRVMLNNPSEIATLKLGVNCQAQLIRANDVIPKIAKGINEGDGKFAIPTKCPSCDGELHIERTVKGELETIDHTKMDEDTLYGHLNGNKYQLRCSNVEDCPAQGLGRIVGFLKSLDVKGFAEKTVEKLLDAGLISTPADLYVVNTVQFSELEGMSDKIVNKLLKELHNKSQKATLPMFIKSLSISGFSSSSTEKAMAKYSTLEELRNASISDLESIDKIGEHKAECLVQGLKNKSDLIDELIKWVPIQKVVTDGPLVGMSFCFTGFRNPILEKKIKEKGGIIKSSATKDLVYLVAKNPDSKSSKLEKARKNGTKIIGIDEMETMVG